MKLLTRFVSLILPLSTLAIPAEKAHAAYSNSKRVASALSKRDEYCYTDTNSHCRESPGLSAKVIKTLSAGDYWYLCYAYGDSVDGNITWDWNEEYGCYVSGTLTASQCNHINLPNCDEF